MKVAARRKGQNGQASNSAQREREPVARGNERRFQMSRRRLRWNAGKLRHCPEILLISHFAVGESSVLRLTLENW